MCADLATESLDEVEVRTAVFAQAYVCWGGRVQVATPGQHAAGEFDVAVSESVAISPAGHVGQRAECLDGSYWRT